MRLLTALGFTFLGALTTSAATITSFTVTNIAQSPFTASLGKSVVGSTASITESTITCTSSVTPCSGAIANFTLIGIGSPGATPISVAIDGILSVGSGIVDAPITSAVATITLPGFPAIPFRIDPGTFSDPPVSASAAADLTGAFSFTGTFGFSSFPAGQTLNLPGSLSFTVGGPTPGPSSVPEPGSAALVGGALLGVVGFLKRRRARA